MSSLTLSPALLVLAPWAADESASYQAIEAECDRELSKIEVLKSLDMSLYTSIAGHWNERKAANEAAFKGLLTRAKRSAFTLSLERVLTVDPTVKSWVRGSDRRFYARGSLSKNTYVCGEILEHQGSTAGICQKTRSLFIALRDAADAWEI